jgi:hypothetical protein
MKTIIMIDHGGVLDAESRSTTATLPQRRQEYQRLGLYHSDLIEEMMEKLIERDTDFRVVTENEQDDPGIFSVMPDAPETFRLLNELVNNYDCELVFHSSNSAEAQVAVKKSLEAAIVNGDVKARINGAGFDPLIASGASKIGLDLRASMRARL